MSTDVNHIPCLYIPFHNRNMRRNYPVSTSLREKGDVGLLWDVSLNAMLIWAETEPGTKTRED